uniref:MAE_28990/MAE_18760 family HEPN-like nuclease n=1 Tax=Vibrio parahaemolyticus TaxID=670 RepID=UPI0004A3AE3E
TLNMSKIRTVEALVDKLDKELSWRRLEISAIKTGIRKAKGNVCKAYIRSAIPLVYAHWEGFIKESASLYLEFVS